MNGVHFLVRGNDRSVRLPTSHKNLAMNHQALVAQETVEAIPSKPFITKMVN